MPFDEKLKFKIKAKAHQACCICKSVGIEVHHIISQANGGKDDFDNAAPLCPSCHEIYGENPTKRKFIKESRDIWYEICSKRFSDSSNILLTNIDSKLDSIHSKLDLERLEASLADSITQNILQGLLENRKSKKGKDLNLQEVISYLFSFKKPTDEKGKKSFDVSRTLILETKGDENEWNKEFNEKRLEFKNKFGAIISEKLILYILKNSAINWYTGITDEQLAKFIYQYFVSMIFLLNHADIEDAEIPLLIKLLPNGLLEARAKFPKP